MGKVTVVGGKVGMEEPVNYPANFSDATWEQVIEACQKNKVPETWEVGDHKVMSMNGNDYQIDIIGKNHDMYSDGSGSAPLTFQMHDVIGIGYQMQTSGTNSGGWQASAVRKTAVPYYFDWMPTEVQTAIKKVNKLTSQGYGSSAIGTTEDTLFLLSEVEIFGTATKSYSGEGTQYEYYKAGNSKKKYNGGVQQTWWTRSPYTNTKYWVAVTDDGSNSAEQGALNQHHLSFAFCF